MDPIAEDGPVEGTGETNLLQCQSATTPAPNLASITDDIAVDLDNMATPVRTPRRRTYDPDAFTPLKDIPRDKYTDQEPLRLWKHEFNRKPKCNFVECTPCVLEEYSTGYQQRPSLTRPKSITGMDVEGELSRSSSMKESRNGLSGLSRTLLSLKLAAAEPPTSSVENIENENKIDSRPVMRKKSVIRRLLRAKTLPIENHAPDRDSLLSFGLTLPARGQVETLESPLAKPFESRLCDGCCRNITMVQKQYVCSDLGCKKRLCDRCHRMMEDAHERGRTIDTTALQTAHTAAEFRERWTKGILSNAAVPIAFKKSFVGAASAYEVGHAITHQNATYQPGAKDDPDRTAHLNLARLEDFFGREHVAMTLRASSATTGSSITADTSPTRFRRLSVGSTEDAWGWGYAAEKREAAAAGRTAPALPAVELQPPTVIATSSPASPNRIVVVSPLSRSNSLATDDSSSVSTLAL